MTPGGLAIISFSDSLFFIELSGTSVGFDPLLPPKMTSQSESPVADSRLTAIGHSSLSMVLSKLISHPIDTIKSRKQAQFSPLIKQNQWRGLYRGGLVATLGAVPGGVTYNLIYENMKGRTSHWSSKFVSYMVSATIAEAVACIFWLPVDIMKENLQVKREGFTHIFRDIRKERGISGLYRAYFGSILAFAPNTALSFAFYEELEEKARERSGGVLPFYLTCGMACLSGGVAAFLTSPLDLVKLRMQIGSGNFRHTFDGVSQIIRKEGVRGLWTGASVRVCLWIPQTTVFLGTYRYLQQEMGEAE